MKVAVFNNVSREYLRREIRDFEEVGLEGNPEAILVRSENLKEKALPDSLQAICRVGSGVDNIDVPWCSARGIVVFNTPGANANAVQELTLWAILSASRNTAAALQFVSENIHGDVAWEKAKKAYRGAEIRGKRVLVIGLGAIGKLVATSCAQLGMNVYGYDPYCSTAIPGIVHVPSLDDMNIYDFITLHTVANKETAQLLNTRFFERVKVGVTLINFARGTLVDAAALSEAIKDNRVRFYASDFIDSSLADFVPERALFLPHLGASTIEAEQKSIEMAVAALAQFWEQGRVENSVNFPTCALGRAGNIRLLVANRNIPGIISKMTQVLGETGHNVAAMVNQSRGEVGYNIIDVDNVHGDMAELTSAIADIPGVTKVRGIGKC